MSVILNLFVVGVATSADHAANACTKTADDVLKSCNQGAQSDFSLALSKCANLTSSVGVCNDQASSDRDDALESCQEEFSVRHEACGKLGSAPYNPAINPADFTTTIDNPYFPLIPGTTFIYEGETADGLEHDEFAVTHRTKVILGVRCVEVHDTVKLDGQLAEDTRDWFAQDLEGNVWYFGENTHELEDGLITTIDGSFISGEDQAQPGIVMEAHPVVGDFYRQEFDLGNAEDFAEVAGLNATVSISLGTFTHCLKTSETTPLEPDLLEQKLYCQGMGNVLEIDSNTGDRIPLIRITHD